MEADAKKRFQVIVAILVAAICLRTAWIFYQRHQGNKPEQKQESYSSNMDDYVMPPKVHPYDVNSAKKELVGKTIWIRAGNQVPYYSFNPSTHEADLKKQAGLMPPLQPLQVKDVVLQRMPKSLGEGQVAVVQKQILLVYQSAGKQGTFAAPAGTVVGDDFNFDGNDAFFFADPHELYKHWPPDVWSAIDQHQAKPGMNETQVSFALGTAGSLGSGDYGNRSIEYSNNGNPVKVTFQNNKAVSVEPEPATPSSR